MPHGFSERLACAWTRIGGVAFEMRPFELRLPASFTLNAFAQICAKVRKWGFQYVSLSRARTECKTLSSTPLSRRFPADLSTVSKRRSMTPTNGRHRPRVRTLFYAVSFSSFSPKLSRQWIGLLCALLCVLSAPHCLLCRLLILRIATQPRRQGRPFLRLPASSLLPSAPGACLSLFHAPPFTQSDRMSEKD